MRTPRLSSLSFVLLLLASPLFSRQNSVALKFLSSVNPASGVTYGEVTSCGDLGIIGAFSTNSSVWIYDFSDRANPVQLAAIFVARSVKDVQVHGRYLFVSFNNGMQWYDILDPKQPKLVHDFRPPETINAHTFFVSGNLLYVADYNSGGVRIYNLADKKNPRLVTSILDGAWGIHDMTVIKGRLYGAWINGQAGVSLVDVSNPAQPRDLAKMRYPQAGTHNAWPTEDGKYVLTTDEVGATRHTLKIWDARTPGQLLQVAEFGVGVSPASTIHNVYVRGRYAYMSYYCEGVHVVDIADPAKPQEVAFYDINGTALCNGYSSTWGVDPFSNIIFASDMQRGLYAFEFADHPAANIAGQVVDARTNAPVPGAMVSFLSEYPSTRTNAAGKFDIAWFRNDTVRVVTEALGYRPDTSVVLTTVTGKTSPVIRLVPLTTGVEQPQELPKNFALLASYPNPLALSQSAPAQIAFRLPQRENVQIEIFNVLGQRVRALLNAPAEAGEHSILWNGIDDRGQRVAAGIYLVHLRAANFVANSRITVIP
jgi:choice-of-anchor B domain-containing protein